jgi:hypothetical protein
LGFVRWHDALSLGVVKPGKLWGPTCPLGVAGDFTGLALYFGPFQLYTRDGLFVAKIMGDEGTGKLGPEVIACELFSGQLVKPEGTDRYFLLAGDQDGRINEVLGLDTVKRLPGGRYTLTRDGSQKAADALAEYQRQLAIRKPLVVVRGKSALPLAETVGKQLEDGRGFEAAMAYDSENLYVRYEVRSPNPLINSIPDPQIIFQGGNVLDIQLATDPGAAADRKQPAAGDVRVLVTRQNGKPQAVLFRPRVSNFQGEPIVLTSPTGKESFHAIETLDDIQLEYRETRSGDGFTATVALPLDRLGWRPEPGQKLKADLGYIFGGRAGTEAAVRAYWSNNSFTANVTGDVPHESRLEPAEWGTALVE